MIDSFQIVRGEIFVVQLPFRFRFRHATADRSENTTIFLKLVSSTGTFGWGETLTRPYLTGETVESVISSIRAWWSDLKKIKFTADDPTSLLLPQWQQADAALAQAAWTLPDIAIRDLWMRSALSGSPVSSNRTYGVSFPVGLGSSPYLSAVARLMKFKHIKFKTDKNIEKTVASIKEWGTSWRSLAIDANGCFAEQDAGLVRNLIKETGAGYFEEPFSRGNYASAAALIRDMNVKVVADESLCSMVDARLLIKERSASVFNIRLAKLGGITGALAVGALAREHGIGIQLGALVGESGLLCNAARLCLGQLSPELVEYSFPGVLLKNNPVTVDVPFFSSELNEISVRSSGLGDINEGKLGRTAVSRLVLE